MRARRMGLIVRVPRRRLCKPRPSVDFLKLSTVHSNLLLVHTRCWKEEVFWLSLSPNGWCAWKHYGPCIGTRCGKMSTGWQKYGVFVGSIVNGYGMPGRLPSLGSKAKEDVDSCRIQ